MERKITAAIYKVVPHKTMLLGKNVLQYAKTCPVWQNIIINTNIGFISSHVKTPFIL